MDENTDFSGWAIVELFGHNQIAGYVTSVALFGTSMMRVDVPGTDDNPGYTKFFGGAAIYAITPTIEEVAKVAVGRLDVRPVDTWIVPEPKRPQLPSSIPAGQYPEDYEESDVQEYQDERRRRRL